MIKGKFAGSLIAALLCSQLVMAQESDFSQCIAGLQDRARQEGLPKYLVDDVLASLESQTRVVELDRSQPEFIQTFANYLNRRVTPQRIEWGRQYRRDYSQFLTPLTSRYGVPGQYLIAFWGLETNYGNYLGKMPTLDSLATLACDERRSSFFTAELMTALMLLHRESLSPQEMQGSWAGAMGHTQFMPSAYSKYAVDGDSDGKINLWKSEQDALASGANFLKNLGWQRGERWGREVLLPNDFPYEESGLANRRPLSYWANLGVRLTSKARLPVVDMQGSILVPAGHAGPAFLVYRNFDVIMRWNRSQSYALSVGLLADSIAGAGSLARPPSTQERPLSRQIIEMMQGKLNNLGYEAGDADGIMGPATRSALREFQLSTGMIADGYPDSATISALAINTEPTS